MVDALGKTRPPALIVGVHPPSQGADADVGRCLSRALPEGPGMARAQCERHRQEVRREVHCRARNSPSRCRRSRDGEWRRQIDGRRPRHLPGIPSSGQNTGSPSWRANGSLTGRFSPSTEQSSGASPITRARAEKTPFQPTRP
jgi:hypothetical protein